MCKKQILSDWLQRAMQAAYWQAGAGPWGQGKASTLPSHFPPRITFWLDSSQFSACVLVPPLHLHVNTTRIPSLSLIYRCPQVTGLATPFR
jgi:hypothetical protein